MKGISEQFYGHLLNAPPDLNLKVEVVKTFPQNVYKKAISLKCWAFTIDEEGKQQLCGFDKCFVHFKPIKVLAIINEYGFIQTLLAHNFVQVAILSNEEAASSYAQRLDALIHIHGQTPFHIDAIQQILDALSEA